ncbi:RNAse Z [Amphibacillus marinus]|uniref:Ribonuclease Z n=1 Tax=Amphibacillus marinus TaxID=872970 RepID=A0A1H8GB70_9BACI|nr:ribonuclease Z [Amphibacillus marinus]SEN40548.1 RNAse Z [Amphibacillus marinus]
MKIEFLGTGAGLPTKQRNVSSLALDLTAEIGSVWLFDCGEGTQHQILRTTIKPRRIDKIFITHLHGDHINGLVGLLSSRSFQNGESLVQIYGPSGIKTYVNCHLSLTGTKLAYPIQFIEVEDQSYYETKHFTITVKELEHGLASFGYRISEKAKPGQLQVDKLLAQGIKPGPIYQQIKENEQTQLPDGRLLTRADFLGAAKPGKEICVLGDTRHPHKFAGFVSDCDLLIHEATFSHLDVAHAHQFYHSTATEVALLAKQANVKQLILTHISARYQGDQINKLADEAQAIFANTLIAEDLLQVDLTNH